VTLLVADLVPGVAKGDVYSALVNPLCRLTGKEHTAGSQVVPLKDYRTHVNDSDKPFAIGSAALCRL
jgi:hypothetical protein